MANTKDSPSPKFARKMLAGICLKTALPEEKASSKSPLEQAGSCRNFALGPATSPSFPTDTSCMSSPPAGSGCRQDRAGSFTSRSPPSASSASSTADPSSNFGTGESHETFAMDEGAISPCVSRLCVLCPHVRHHQCDGNVPISQSRDAHLFVSLHRGRGGRDRQSDPRPR